MKSSNKPIRVEILRRHSLIELEALLTRLSNAQSCAVDLWLPAEVGAQFFKDTLIADLIAVAGARCRNLTIVDWIANPDETHLQRFRQTIEGLAAIQFADEIVDSKRNNLSNRLRDFRLRAIEQDLTGTPEGNEGKVITLCAFDPEFPTPIDLVGRDSKSAFVSRILGLRKRYFEVGSAEGFSEQAPQVADKEVAGFAYELWQNAEQHGRFDNANSLVKGMRFLRMRKHVALTIGELLGRAQGYPELQSYFERVVGDSRNPKFHEITISDSGTGIADRFLATRPEFREGVDSSAEHQAALINRIIDESLTSKLNQPGAGHGLEHAMEAVDALRGFLSVRTGISWLYHAFGSDRHSKERRSLLRVEHQLNLASVGTHFNLIYPLKEA